MPELAHEKTADMDSRACGKFRGCLTDIRPFHFAFPVRGLGGSVTVGRVR